LQNSDIWVKCYDQVKQVPVLIMFVLSIMTITITEIGFMIV